MTGVYTILGIDPGTYSSGMAWFDGARCVASTTMENGALLSSMRRWSAEGGNHATAIERIVGTGKKVGSETFETAEMVGRLIEILTAADAPHALLSRHQVLRALDVPRGTGSADSRVRARLVGMLGSPGTSGSPGPTYGVTGHEWQALAVAVAARRIADKTGTPDIWQRLKVKKS